ncbi:hypothetical protein EYF80_016156 [Liparis tanakae]|uniref:CCHC-type domain-containing protein n=1 Tax=Liparis tanakae TaxID=230148 RepID=A0A4Z2I721_9TELE|nr:hypothetical protein EYF80_016156 [Liparis tanakae]
MLTYYFLEGMDEQISSLLRKHVIGLNKMLISLVRLHAVHHERKLREAEEEKERARVLLKERWMKAQIQALQGGGGGGGRRGNYGCWNCGDPNHWARDCNRPRGGAQLCVTYVEEEEEEDEDSRGW